MQVILLCLGSNLCHSFITEIYKELSGLHGLVCVLTCSVMWDIVHTGLSNYLQSVRHRWTQIHISKMNCALCIHWAEYL